MKIVISGSHGLIGTKLCETFTREDHQVSRLVRHHPLGYQDAIESIYYDPLKEDIAYERLQGTDVVIHLAGESISAGQWSEDRKRSILVSRVQSTGFLARSLAKLRPLPRMLITASAAGYYGPSLMGAALTESSPKGTGFLSDVCQAWEAAAAPANEAGITVIHLRFGVVLSRAGGMLGKMLPLFNAGLGGKAGSGEQPVSWIALDEIPEIVKFLLGHANITGPVNCVDPAPVPNETFSRSLARLLKKPCYCPWPGPMIQLALGEMGEELILQGNDVRPARLIKAGYRFKCLTLDEALRAALK
jgi:hypothetical protein